MQENKNYSWEALKNKFKEHNGNENSSEEKNEINAREEAETSIQELMNRYSERVRENFDLTAKKLREERDNALRENWVLQQKAEAALPEQMAAAGLNGGASETGLVNLKAKYQDARNEIQDEFADNLSDLSQKTIEQEADAKHKYNEKWLEYLLSLAKENTGR